MKGFTDKAQRTDESSPSPLLEQLLHNFKSGSSVEQSHHCSRTPAEIPSSSYFLIWLAVSGEFESSGQNKWLNIKIFHHPFPRVMSQFGFSEMLKLQDKNPSYINSSFLSWTSTMTLSEGERSLSVNLDAFQPPLEGHPESCGSGRWGGDGEGLGGQWSTTAKRHIYWPKCWLHSLTSGPVQALGPDLRGWTFYVQHQAV